MKNIPLILMYLILYFLGVWILTTYEEMKAATAITIAMLWAVSLIMIYYHKKDLRRAVRKAEFYFLWKIMVNLLNAVIEF